MTHNTTEFYWPKWWGMVAIGVPTLSMFVFAPIYLSIPWFGLVLAGARRR